MTYTGRIRLHLILVAILPLLIVMLMIWQQTQEQAEQTQQRNAEVALSKFAPLEESITRELVNSVNEYSSQRAFKRTVRELETSETSRLTVDPTRYDLSFAEIVNGDGTVRASYDRSGLLGRLATTGLLLPSDSKPLLLQTIEYDKNGPHVALLSITTVGEKLYLYAGRFIDRELLKRMSDMTGAEFALIIEPEEELVYTSMQANQLYRTDTGFESVISGSESQQFYLIARFANYEVESSSTNLLGMAALVGIISVLISIGAGLYITGRTKREIDNLVDATTRVARGDLNRPIMAYEEGEFSELADSFSSMMVDLKKLQSDLATSEKIAAWQSMGRKIAHEIRNPMTPIAISADDLRRSYHEKLPDFDKTLEQTTSMIHNEVARLSRLLDEFVSFAKMPAPELRPTEIGPLIADLQNFYRQEIDAERLTVSSSFNKFLFSIDRDAIWQLLINLTKNGLETGVESKVQVRFDSGSGQLTIEVKDNGPGFNEGLLTGKVEPYISTKPEGSGLGLVICQRIAIDHGGSIEFSNNEEGGAVVKIKLPDNTDA